MCLGWVAGLCRDGMKLVVLQYPPPDDVQFAAVLMDGSTAHRSILISDRSPTDTGVMADRKFAHLHLHTHYSLLDGFNRIPAAGRADEEARHERRAPSPTTATCTGRSSSTRECKKAGHQPGHRLRGVPRPRRPPREEGRTPAATAYYAPHAARQEHDRLQEPHQAVVASRSSKASTTTRASTARLLEAHSEGLICLSGCLAGRVQPVHPQGPGRRRRRSSRSGSRKLFGDDFYIEIQNNGIDLQDQCTPVAVGHRRTSSACRSWPPPTPTTCAPTTPRPTTCSSASTPARSATRGRSSTPKGGCRTRTTSAARRTCTGCSRTSRTRSPAARRSPTGCDIELDFKKRHFPVFDAAEGQDAGGVPARALRAGRDASATATTRRRPCATGSSTNSASSARWASPATSSSSGTSSGSPASRASRARPAAPAAGRSCRYVLYLSHVCPLEYDLLFERFLDPNRSEPPDIDIDFCQDRRELVIEYVKQKYGARVASRRSARSARWRRRRRSRTWAACSTSRSSASTACASSCR